MQRYRVDVRCLHANAGLNVRSELAGGRCLCSTWQRDEWTPAVCLCHV